MRTAQLDADNRRDTNGAETYCARCHKPLKNGQPHRWVRPVDWSFAEVMHADDVTPEIIEATERGEYPGAFPVGMDCAKKIGMQFTTA